MASFLPGANVLFIYSSKNDLTSCMWASRFFFSSPIFEHAGALKLYLTPSFFLLSFFSLTTILASFPELSVSLLLIFYGIQLRSCIFLIFSRSLFSLVGHFWLIYRLGLLHCNSHWWRFRRVVWYKFFSLPFFLFLLSDLSFFHSSLSSLQVHFYLTFATKTVLSSLLFPIPFPFLDQTCSNSHHASLCFPSFYLDISSIAQLVSMPCLIPGVLMQAEIRMNFQF